MKKIIIILSILFCSNAYAVTLLWDATMQSTWDTEESGNTAIYQRLLSEVTNNTCSTDDFGTRAAILYKTTGNATYATTSYNKIASLIQTGTGPDSTRERGVPIALSASMIWDALSAGQKSTIDAEMDIYHDKVLGISPYGNHGTLMTDSDNVIGHYFGLVLYAISRMDDDPTYADWLTECSPNSLYKCVGGLDATGANTNTWRNTIYRYFNDLAQGGEWIESSHYNPGTLRLAIQGVEAINKYYGSDKFPEVTALYDNFANNYYERVTPNYAQPFHWGDVESQSVRNHLLFRSMVSYSMMAYLYPNDQNMYDLRDSLYSGSSCYIGDHYFWYKPPSAVTRTKQSGVSGSNAPGVGTAYWHSGWNSNDTFMASFMAGKVGVDHEMDALNNFALYRNQQWVVNWMQGYYGHPYQDSPYYNNLLLFGAFTGMYEGKGQTGYEHGSNYMYHAGTTSGLYHKNGADDPSPVFIKEYTRQILYLRNTDNSDTIVVQDRFDACNPSSTTCMSSYKYSRLPHPTNNLYRKRVSAVSAKHQWLLNTNGAVSQTGDVISWTAADGNTVYLNVGIPSYTVTDLTLGSGTSIGTNTTPYYFIDNNGSTPIHRGSEGKHQLRLQVSPNTNDYEFVDWINVIHTGSSNPTITELADNLGTEDAKAVLIDGASQKKLIIFNDTRDTTTTFTSTINGTQNCQGAPGFCANYDPNRLSKAFAMTRFKYGSNIEFSTADTEDIVVYIVGLDSALSWTVTKDGNPAGCTPSSEDLCIFTLAGSVGGHEIEWTVGGGGGPTCNDNCTVCSSQSACDGSALTCYWHDNDGGTALGCWDYQETSVLCAADPAQCPTSQYCTDAGWCWQNGACISSCPPPPTGTTIQLTPTADITLRDGSFANTNQDGLHLVAKSSSASDFSRATCMKFDLSSIPASSDIQYAKLNFRLQNNSNAVGTVRIHECLRNWNETQATWNVYSTGNSWTTAGAKGNGTDINGVWNGSTGSLGQYSIGGAELIGQLVTFTDGGLGDHVESNIGGSINICIHQNGTDNANFFGYDSENATSSNRPYMEVNYIEAPVASSSNVGVLQGGRYVGKFGG